MNYEENQINEPLEVYAGKVHFPIPHAGCMIGHIEAPYRDLDLKEVTDPTEGSKQFTLRIENGKA